MKFDTNSKWGNRALWAVMVTTLILAQIIITKTGFHLPSNYCKCIFIWSHIVLFFMSQKTGGSLFDNRKPNRKPYLKHLIQFLDLWAGVLVLVILTRSWGGDITNKTSNDWSVIFLGLVSVYLLCLTRVICPGVQLSVQYMPFIAAAKLSFISCIPLFLPILSVVVTARILLEECDMDIAKEAVAAAKPPPSINLVLKQEEHV